MWDLTAVHRHRDLHRASFAGPCFTGLLHCIPFAWACVAALIAAQTRAGVAGMSMWRTPRWLTASMTAFWVAGAAPIVPASPMPLAPSGFMSVGVSLGSSSKLQRLGPRAAHRDGRAFAAGPVVGGRRGQVVHVLGGEHGDHAWRGPRGRGIQASDH